MSLPIGNTASDINAETIAGPIQFHAWLGGWNRAACGAAMQAAACLTTGRQP